MLGCSLLPKNVVYIKDKRVTHTLICTRLPLISVTRRPFVAVAPLGIVALTVVGTAVWRIASQTRNTRSLS